MPDEALKDVLLGVFEASLDAQLRAVRRLRRGEPTTAPAQRATGRSQVGMAFDILKSARAPLHVSEILSRLEARFGFPVDPESLGCSWSENAARGDHGARSDRNTFSPRSETRGRPSRCPRSSRAPAP